MERTCNKCGWVHFGVTREFAELSVERFNAYFETLSPFEQQDYYSNRKASIESYLKCFNCGNSYTDFRNSKDDDAPYGVTIQPILDEENV